MYDMNGGVNVGRDFAHDVSTVMIDGRFIIKDGVVLTQDEPALRRKAQVSADGLAQRAGSDQFKNRTWRSSTI